MSVALRRPRLLPLARLFVVTLGSLVLAAAAAPAVLAVPGLDLSTPFPAIRVEPGATATFDIKLDTTESRRVDLAVSGVPQDWKASFRGGGAVIDSVFVASNATPDVTLSVEVPQGAASGDTRLTVTASSGGLKETLPIDVRISEQAAGSVSMTTDFAELQGPSDTSFSFNLTLKNDTPADIAFGLTTQGPAGWEVKATPSGESQATTVTVKAGETSTISVSAKPAPDAPAQDYPIKVTATGGNKTATADLKVTVTGSFSMTFSTPNQVLSTTANAGATKQVQFTIENTGTAPLTNVKLSASTIPDGWKFDAGQPIPAIAPKEVQTITANLTPANQAIAGDYAVQFRAAAAEKTENMTYRVTVETPQLWGILGIVLIVVVLAGLYWVFRTYGRR
jgi:uncharacterized membrane protein